MTLVLGGGRTKPIRQSFTSVELVALAVVITLSISLFAYGQDGFTIRSTGRVLLLGVTAKSGSATDIQAAIDQVVASGGVGNVYVPAGTFNFYNAGETWRTVQVPAGVNIIGAAPNGSDSLGIPIAWNTVLVMPYDVPGTPDNKAIWFDLGTSSWSGHSSSRTIRFANIKFQGYRTINPSSITEHIALTVNGLKDFRIDHCCFENTAGGAVCMPTWYDWNLYCSGVIDHCKMYNTAGFDDLVNYQNGNIGYGVELQRAYAGVTFDPTMNVLGKYTNYTVFIENCYFSKWRHCVSSGHGAYYVFRHNIVNQDFGHFSLDVHGLRDTEANRAGGRGMEVYENNFTNQVEFGGLFQDGGGCGVWFNNYVDSSYDKIALYAEDYVASSIWHLADFYMWGAKGTIIDAGYPTGTIDPSRHVVEAWNRSAYDPTDPRYPNIDPSWIIVGYKPYTYPHPLTLG